MRKLFFTFAAAAAALLLIAGCSTANEAVKAASAKNVSAQGFVSVQDVDTGYDPITGSVTPKLLLVTGNLRYRSNIVAIPEGSAVPDAAEYSREESSSIWNASAKTTTVNWSFTASTPEAAAERMKALIEFEAKQAAAQAPQPATDKEAANE